MPTADATELLDVERRFWDAMKTKDADAASSMTDDGCIVVGAQGVSSIDRRMMGKLTADGKWTPEQYSFDEKNARVRYRTDDIGRWRCALHTESLVGDPFGRDKTKGE